ncbi:MAG: IS66 family transposase [Thermoanaerobaculia bacterium]
MADTRVAGCPGCEALSREVEALKREVAALRTQLAEALAELARARKNSRNSSKPPSSDIVKPKPAAAASKKTRKRKRGAQPGHPRHERAAFQESQIDHFWDYTWPACPDCGTAVEPSHEPPRVIQQVELAAVPVEISEHRGRACWCPNCRKTHYAPIDEDVRRAGLVGPRLTALVAYLKGACHCSYSTIRRFLKDVAGLAISRGQLRKVCAKVSDSLEPAWTELLDRLPRQDRLNVDETGHKNNKQQMWTWCFRASLFTLFKIDASRGSQVLLDVLGEEFAGVLGCDYFSAYRKYMRLNENVLVQFCLAHLIRDIKFLVTHPQRRNRAYGRRVLQAARGLFVLFHRRQTMSARRFALECEDAANELCGAAKFHVPRTPEAQNLAERFWRHGESYLRFLTTPGVEPTNNLAEQAIRFVVIDRHVTQGSRSEAGQRWLERIWTAIATCAQQGQSVFEFLHESILAHFRDHPPPSLLPNTS